MFTLKEIVAAMPWMKDFEVWEGKLACTEGSVKGQAPHYAFESLKVYGFILVRRGSMRLRYRGREILYRQGEMQVYFPYMPVETLDYSSDFDGIALFFDIDLLEQSPMCHQLFRGTSVPLQSRHEPKIVLGAVAAERIGDLMHTIHHYVSHASASKGEMLYSLCGVFLFDLLEEQGIEMAHTATPSRGDELLQRFLALVTDHYAEQHELPFYAERLCITTTYLSRLVRQMFGCTAKDIINRALLAEAEYQLRTTSLTISQIADNLNFADQASFNHFFARQKGISPSVFRRGAGEGERG